MPKLNMTIPHQLPADEAQKRIRELLGGVKSQFAEKISDLKEEWREDGGTFSFKAMGFAVSGTITLKPSEVELKGDLPFAATFFKGKIETTIRERAKTLLA